MGGMGGHKLRWNRCGGVYGGVGVDLGSPKGPKTLKYYAWTPLVNMDPCFKEWEFPKGLKGHKQGFLTFSLTKVRSLGVINGPKPPTTVGRHHDHGLDNLT